MAEHRVSMLGTSLRRYEDPARSADPRIRELVVALATLEPTPAPRAHFRAELRAQLVAVAPRLVAEGPTIEGSRAAKAPATPLPTAAKPLGAKLATALRWSKNLPIARPLAAITAVVAIFAMLLGGAVWISKKALPGDTLYALKRANENVELSLANGDAAKGRDYLNFAQTRTDEVSALLSRSSAMADGAGPSAAGGVNSHTAKLITTTLDSADSDVRNGAQLLAGQAVRDRSAHSLSILTGWAPGQVHRLQSITDRLAAGALRDRAAASTQLAAAALSRAQALRAMLSCSSLDNAPTDDLGPVPSTVCAATTDPAHQPGAPATPHSSTSAKRGTPTQPKATDDGGTESGGPATLPIDPGTVSGTSGVATSRDVLPLPIPLPIPLPLLTTATSSGTSPHLRGVRAGLPSQPVGPRAGESRP